MYLIFKARKVGITFSPFSDESLRSSPLPPSPRLPWLHGKKWGSRNSDPGPLIPNPVFFLLRNPASAPYSRPLCLITDSHTCSPWRLLRRHENLCSAPAQVGLPEIILWCPRGSGTCNTLKGKRGDSFQMSLLSSIQHSFWYLEFPLSPFHPFAFM